MRCHPSGHSPSQTVAVWGWQGAGKEGGRELPELILLPGMGKYPWMKTQHVGLLRTRPSPREKEGGCRALCLFLPLHIYQGNQSRPLDEFLFSCCLSCYRLE